MLDFLLGMCIGLLLGGLIILSHLDSSKDFQSFSEKTLIEECEKTMPRDQHCYLTAIPENEGTNK